MSEEGGGGFGGGGISAGGSQKGVFISHSSEDAPLANAFRDLIHDVSAGMLTSYSSSSKDKDSGIPYGEDWFRWIQDRIRESGNVVALITPSSVGKPWILFEAGFGVAMDKCRVFGLRLGTTAEEAYAGPFTALQNSGSDTDDVTKLCWQLFEGTQCQPRNEAVKMFVGQFLAKVESHFAAFDDTPREPNPESEAVFRALEEIKGLVQTTRGFSDDLDDSKMMEMDMALHFCLSRSSELGPTLRVSMLLGIAVECGYGWIKPAVDQALREPVDIGILENVVMHPELSPRRLRRAAFPPNLLLRELFRALKEYQELRFMPRPLRMTKVRTDKDE